MNGMEWNGKDRSTMKAVTIENDFLIVQISPYGAEMTSIKGKSENLEHPIEYLWQGDSTYWEGRAPVLFPYIARLTNGRYRLYGKEYKMDIHGFAKDSLFEISKQQQHSVTLTFKHSEETYRQYPYHFRVDITYRLDVKCLNVIFCVNNLDEKPMFFGIGGHPGFNVPLTNDLMFEDYVLEFDQECHPKRIEFSEDCFVTGDKSEFALTEGRYIPLHHDLFDKDAIVLTDVSNGIVLKTNKDCHGIKVSFPEMEYLGIWHMPHTDAPYVCIEPWTSLPSRSGVIEQLEEKSDLIRLEGGAIYRNSWSIEIM